MARSRSTDNSSPTGAAGRGPAGGVPGRGRSGATAVGATATGAKESKGSGRGKPAKAPKLGKDGKPKVSRLRKLKNQAAMIRQAYSLTYRSDRRLPWLMLIAFVVVFAVVEVLGIVFDAPFLVLPIALLLGLLAALVVFAVVEVLGIVFDVPFLMLPMALLLGLLAALVVFGRRAQGSAYRQVEGQPGAAAWVLEGMRGDWRVSSGVAGTRELDAVHRVLGRPGVILVGEGNPQRVRTLIAAEKRRIAKVVGDAPIYDVSVGDAEGQVPLKKLNTHVVKLPRNLSAGEVNALAKRMSALGGARPPVPGGPLPGGRQMSVSQRQVRRR